VVEHSPVHPNVKGLSRVTATGTKGNVSKKEVKNMLTSMAYN